MKHAGFFHGGRGPRIQDRLTAMKKLHTVTAVIEAGTGLTLLAVPSLVVTLLLGSPLDSPVAVMLGRVTGAALLALGLACWLARKDQSSPATLGLVTAILVYNGSVAVLLAYAGTALGMSGRALWPAVVLHLLMAVWSVWCLKKRHNDPPPKA